MTLICYNAMVATTHASTYASTHTCLLGIFVLTLDRPAAKNALGRTLLSQFRQSINDLRFNEYVTEHGLNSCIDSDTIRLIDGLQCAGLSI